MLQRLHVQHYALIESVEVEFGPGLNVLTGETGAGKSLLMGALGLILGRRAESALLSASGQKCVVEAEFNLSGQPELLQRFAGAEWHEEGLESSLIVRREITASGKSRAFINDTPVNLPELRQLTEELIDLHGQHEGQHLMETSRQLAILDRYAGLTERVAEFGRVFSAYRNCRQEAENLRAQETEAKRRSDYLNFQVQELRDAQISVDEESQIDKELRFLHHAEQLGETLQQAIQTLDRQDDAVSSRLAEQTRQLERIASLHDKLAAELGKIEQARILIEDATRELEAIGESIDLDPRRLAFLEERLSLYHRLKLKYGARSSDELVAMLADFERELASIGRIDERVVELEAEADRLSEQLVSFGASLTEARKAAAAELQSSVEATLREVALVRAEFYIDLQPLASAEGVWLNAETKARADGLDAVAFMIRTNAGQAFGPLGSIASGGELSRVMLSVKAALAARMELAVLIFDEIDTGISGEIALKVGRVMERIAEKHQLIVITHLPQIASRGNRHYYIYKEVIENNTYSRVRELSQEERVSEIAKIMSGENPTANALQSAWELLRLGR